MTSVRVLLSRIRALAGGRRRDDELAEEIEAHLDLLTGEHVRRGLSRAEARVAARRAFGGIDQMKERYRDQRGLPFVETLAQDVRFAIRTFGRTPSFTAVCVLILALGVGANTAIFSVVRQVLIKPLDVARPGELVELACINPNEPDYPICQTSYPGFRMFAEANEVLAGIFGFSMPGPLNAVHRGRAEIVTPLVASGTVFDVLQLAPATGRLFTPADDRTGAELVAVLGHAYWLRRYGGDPGVVGQTLTLNQQPVTIIGVAPRSFRGVTFGEVPDIVLPIATADLFRRPNSLTNCCGWWVRMIGRRRADTSLRAVQAALEPVYRRTQDYMLASLPPQAAAELTGFVRGFRFEVREAALGSGSLLRQSLERPLVIVSGVCAIIWLIACANIAALLLARAMGRRRELALRLAIGASRGRLVRQVLTEGVLLAAMGGAVGLAAAQWFAAASLRMGAGDGAIQAVDLGPDTWVFGFTALGCLVTGLAVGVASVFHATRRDPQEALREVRGAGRTTGWTRGLVTAQVALTVVLVFAAGLFLQTLTNLLAVDPGFRTRHLLTLAVEPGLAGYDRTRASAFLRSAVDAIERLPGVESATFAHLPIGTGHVRQTGVKVIGSETGGVTSRHQVGPRFFETLGMTVIRGRGIRQSDRASAVAVVNESFARRFFGSSDAVGRSFRMLNADYDVVGVVRDARDRSVKQAPEPWVYTPFEHEPERSATIAVHLAGQAAATSQVRQTIQQLDPAVPIGRVTTIEALRDDMLGRERLLASLSAAFSLVALLLVALGLYGMFSGMVTRRTPEIGVRIALGARRGQILGLLARDAAWMTATGLGAGLLGAIWVTRLIRQQLFGITPTDPTAVIATVLALAIVSALGVWLPARRAIHLDPVTALRCE